MRRWGYFYAILFIGSISFAAELSVPIDYGTIQEAIDAAFNGDTVIVSPGTYYEKLDMDGKAITLSSIDPNDPAVIASTIIDGSGLTNVILCNSGEKADTVITGLTIQNGDIGPGSGGGVYCYNSYPTIRNCVFLNNSAGYGGAIYCYGLGVLEDPLIANCIFIGNGAGSQGGGVYARNASPAITNCTFTGNSAANGGGVATRDASPLVTNCTFSGNAATNAGGGLYSGNNSDSVVSNCIFWGNTALTRPEIYVASTSDPVIRYSIAEGCGGSGAGWKSFYGIDGGHNLDQDPLFADPYGPDTIAGTVDDNLHLQPGSPGINAGDPNMVFTGQVDMDFQDRVFDGRVDMGADEAVFFFFDSDLNGDGQVDLADLVLFVDSDFWLVMVDLNEFAQFSRDWLVGVPEDGELSGNGSEGNPYLIKTLADFDIFADPNNAAIYWAGGVHTKLMTDIDLSDRTYTSAVIGFFEGVFDGNDFSIRNLTINTADADNRFIGLFASLGFGAEVENLGIDNITIRSNSTLVGGLTGVNSVSSTITNCYVTGSISGWGIVGGLSGSNEGGSITDSYVIGTISGDNIVGGICGKYLGDIGDGGTLNHCFTAGTITAEGTVGGLVGQNFSGSITNCYSNSDVNGNFAVGGVAGRNEGGGLTNCYSTGDVRGDYSIGGLVGINDYPLITNCFWDVETSGIADPEEGLPDTDGMIGLSTALMMTQSTFAGWDFSTPEWMMLRAGEDYPRLAWQEIFDGDIAGLYGVDMADFAEAAKHWGLDDCNGADDCGRADIDEDGEVGLGDLVRIADDWLRD